MFETNIHHFVSLEEAPMSTETGLASSETCAMLVDGFYELDKLLSI